MIYLQGVRMALNLEGDMFAFMPRQKPVQKG
jgi:hypothetical protein